MRNPGPVFSFALVPCAPGLIGSPVRAADTGKPQADRDIHATLATVTPAAKEFTEDDVTEAVKAIVAQRSKDGVFTMQNPWTGTDLTLVFDEVRLVRGLQGYGWFPNVVFHDKADPDKQYALDFGLLPEGDQLKLMDTRVQKEPKPDSQSG